MGKWIQCLKCGATTDQDETHCPTGCFSEGEASQIKIVELTSEEIQELLKKGKIWTKRPTQFWTNTKNPPL